MGGSLKFPKRKKFSPPEDIKHLEKENVSEEEHTKRLNKLREMGLIK